MHGEHAGSVRESRASGSVREGEPELRAQSRGGLWTGQPSSTSVSLRGGARLRDGVRGLDRRAQTASSDARFGVFSGSLPCGKVRPDAHEVDRVHGTERAEDGGRGLILWAPGEVWVQSRPRFAFSIPRRSRAFRVIARALVLAFMAQVLPATAFADLSVPIRIPIAEWRKAMRPAPVVGVVLDAPASHARRSVGSGLHVHRSPEKQTASCVLGVEWGRADHPTTNHLGRRGEVAWTLGERRRADSDGGVPSGATKSGPRSEGEEVPSPGPS